jgi:hypothetical protein
VKKRSIGNMVALWFCTFGLYGLIWYIQTANEMNEEGAQIPSAWLVLVPVANWYWIWKWAGGVEHITQGRSARGATFALMFLNIIGMAIVQDSLNKAIDRGLPAKLPELPVARIV